MVSFPAIIDESAQRYLKQEGPAYVLLIRNPDNTPYPFFDLLEDYFESNEDVFTLLLSLEGGDILLYRINRKALPTN
jgi:hypothetical protein